VIPVRAYEGRDVAVFGLGRTGISAAKALLAGGARVHAWDDNEATRAKAEAAGIKLSDINKRDWQGFAALVLSPGVPLYHPKPHRVVEMARATGVPIIGDMELFAMAVNALDAEDRPKIIGITGTNGKSTTTALIGHILKQAGKDVRVGGNIGIGVLDLAVLHARAIYVLELSSYQLDLVETLRCDAAILLNITPDHLDRHGSMQAYTAAKARIFNNQGPNDVAIVGIDTAHTQVLYTHLASSGGRKLCPVSARSVMGEGVSVIDGKLYDCMRRAQHVADLNQAPSLPGKHNWQNAAAAYAACRAMGLSREAITAGLMSFPGLAHRCEFVATIEGVRFVNDSKATNADATEQALRAFPRVYWIAGGQAKSDGIAPLTRLFGQVSRAYLIGEASGKYRAILDAADVSNKECGTLDLAVAAAFADAKSDAEQTGEAVVLLSPASASFDQFRDFEHRGDVFRELVLSLANKSPAKRTPPSGKDEPRLESRP
jgi:UDP-N-acetylmuramoylalanine--D-glutamate ligase